MLPDYPSTCLVSPLHDPEGRLFPMIKRSGKDLARIYHKKVGVSISESTDKNEIEFLKNLGFETYLHTGTAHVGINYISALRLGIEMNTASIHLVDFDRALHWTKRFPHELRDIRKILPSNLGFTSFIRSDKAFESHPYIQKSTEEIINRIASQFADTQVDIMSGSFGFSQNLAKYVVKHAKRPDFGIYAEFLVLAKKAKSDIDTLEVDGLEWETPDQFEEKIQKEGYLAWLEEFESKTEFEKRKKLFDQSLHVLGIK